VVGLFDERVEGSETNSKSPFNAVLEHVLGQLMEEGRGNWAGFMAPMAFGLERGLEHAFNMVATMIFCGKILDVAFCN
jgi:hypothetical protein